MSGAEFIGIPNNVVIMSMYLAGLFCSVILMRAVYISSERIKQYHTYELTLAVNGVKWYSTMVAANFVSIMSTVAIVAALRCYGQHIDVNLSVELGS